MNAYQLQVSNSRKLQSQALNLSATVKGAKFLNLTTMQLAHVPSFPSLLLFIQDIVSFTCKSSEWRKVL